MCTHTILSLDNDIKSYGLSLKVDSDIYKQYHITEMPNFDRSQEVKFNHDLIIGQLEYMKTLFTDMPDVHHIEGLNICVVQMIKSLQTQYDYLTRPLGCLYNYDLLNTPRYVSCIICPTFKNMTERALRWNI